ncbi:MAG: putative DsbA family dithiol-disulfide isomerase [Candidatus Azotimanducaceae bacterium]|jgi:predicted DsbA family dithiol-disulfide isomerase
MTDAPISTDINESQGPVLDIDIVSDVMCPWCIIGYKQLERALAITGMRARIRWHPFELNPNMPLTGQNTSEHIQEKYGSTPEQSAQSRNQMQALGQELGFTFNWSPESRMWNTLITHQLLDFALSQGKQHPLKMALLTAHFTDQRDLSKKDVLIDVATSVGLSAIDAARVIDSGELADTVREKQQFWTSRGVSGVPSMIFGGKYLVTGAQGVDNYAEILRRTAAETEAA